MNKKIYKKYNGRIYNLVYEMHDNESENSYNGYKDTIFLNTNAIDKVQFRLIGTEPSVKSINGVNSNKDVMGESALVVLYLVGSEFFDMFHKEYRVTDYAKFRIKRVFYE